MSVGRVRALLASVTAVAAVLLGTVAAHAHGAPRYVTTTPAIVAVGDVVTFGAPPNATAHYEWLFGDEEEGTEPAIGNEVTHVYTVPGTYTAMVSFNHDGRLSPPTLLLIVVEEALPPRASLSVNDSYKVAPRKLTLREPGLPPVVDVVDTVTGKFTVKGSFTRPEGAPPVDGATVFSLAIGDLEAPGFAFASALQDFPTAMSGLPGGAGSFRPGQAVSRDTVDVGVERPRLVTTTTLTVKYSDRQVDFTVTGTLKGDGIGEPLGLSPRAAAANVANALATATHNLPVAVSLGLESLTFNLPVTVRVARETRTYMVGGSPERHVAASVSVTGSYRKTR